MNIIAVDIGNTNFTIALFLNDIQAGIEKVAGDNREMLEIVLENFWLRIPVSKASKEKKRNGVIVAASVKEKWTESLRQIAKEKLGEKIYEIGLDKQVPLPMDVDVDEPEKLGIDRVMNAYAAYTVVGDAAIVADFGTAVTIDMIDAKGVFLGGVIAPGIQSCADGLVVSAEALPKIKDLRVPEKSFGKNTNDAVNAGLYYQAVGLLETVSRLFSEHLGTWPHTIVTGGDVEKLKPACNFVDSFVTDLTVKGIVLTYQKFIEDKK